MSPQTSLLLYIYSYHLISGCPQSRSSDDRRRWRRRQRLLQVLRVRHRRLARRRLRKRFEDLSNLGAAVCSPVEPKDTGLIAGLFFFWDVLLKLFSFSIFLYYLISLNTSFFVCVQVVQSCATMCLSQSNLHLCSLPLSDGARHQT